MYPGKSITSHRQKLELTMHIAPMVQGGKYGKIQPEEETGNKKKKEQERRIIRTRKGGSSKARTKHPMLKGRPKN